VRDGLCHGDFRSLSVWGQSLSNVSRARTAALAVEQSHQSLEGAAVGAGAARWAATRRQLASLLHSISSQAAPPAPTARRPLGDGHSHRVLCSTQTLNTVLPEGIGASCTDRDAANKDAPLLPGVDTRTQPTSAPPSRGVPSLLAESSGSGVDPHANASDRRLFLPRGHRWPRGRSGGVRHATPSRSAPHRSAPPRTAPPRPAHLHAAANRRTSHHVARPRSSPSMPSSS